MTVGAARTARRAEPSASLLIATYNWKEALARVLASARSQVDPPDEVLVADDGSRPDTREVIEREQRNFPVPLVHVWHEDRGFRLGAIRNRAIAAARSDYVIQVDGDMVLHPAFVRGHRWFARRGSYVQGSRAMLDAARTARCVTTVEQPPGPLGRGLTNRVNAVYAPFLAHFVRGPQGPLRRTRGCHMAFWRDDLIRVNGYDEELTGWGREDSELAARLHNAGIRRRNLKFAAVAWHLHHQSLTRQDEMRNHAVFERTMREGRTRCAAGLDQYLK